MDAHVASAIVSSSLVDVAFFLIVSFVSCLPFSVLWTPWSCPALKRRGLLLVVLKVDVLFLSDFLVSS